MTEILKTVGTMVLLIVGVAFVATRDMVIGTIGGGLLGAYVVIVRDHASSATLAALDVVERVLQDDESVE